MTIFTNSIFPTLYKFIQFGKDSVNAISGANTLSSLPLCDIKTEFEQYQRLSMSIPANQTDFVLTFPTLGIKPTFIAIKPKYCSLDENSHYLKWKFSSSTDPKLSFTSILILTGTSSNPIPAISIDNLDQTNPVVLEVLVSAVENDYINDVIASTYLDNLMYFNVHTYNDLPNGILALHDSTDQLATTIDFSDIVNVQRVVGENRLIIDDSSTNNIILDFVSEFHTLQALSAINWVMYDPINRSLPRVGPDQLPPVITFNPLVISNAIIVEIPVNATYTKQDFLDDTVLSITDDTDDTIALTVDHITFKDDQNNIIPNIVNAGTYTGKIEISDIAGNITIHVITITAQMNIVDTTPPVISTTASVTGNVLLAQQLADYGGIIDANDLRVEALLSIIDNFDGPIPLSSVMVTIINMDTLPSPTVVTTITAPGNYSITFIVYDSAGNPANLTLSLIVNP